MRATRLLRHFEEAGITPATSLVRVVLVFALLDAVAAASNSNQQVPAQKTPSDATAQTTQDKGDVGQLRKRVEQLTAELTRVKKRVTELEKIRRVDAIQDKLGKEEQRAEMRSTERGRFLLQTSYMYPRELSKTSLTFVRVLV